MQNFEALATSKIIQPQRRMPSVGFAISSLPLMIKARASANIPVRAGGFRDLEPLNAESAAIRRVRFKANL
jgi:hypothetical protein